MLAKRIIPCLDIEAGRVVKGVQFVDLRDAGDPVEAARAYDQSGADELVLLDIKATWEGRGVWLATVERVAEAIFIPFTVGGGIRSLAEARDLLLAGADKISINSAALERPALISELAEHFGRQAVVLAIDVRREAEGYRVYRAGGRIPTAREAISWAQEGAERGAGEILLTSMDRDGTHLGYDLELTRQVAEAVSIPVIASGGAGRLEDFLQVLTVGRAEAALAAGVFHFGEIRIPELKAYLAQHGVVVRETYGTRSDPLR